MKKTSKKLKKSIYIVIAVLGIVILAVLYHKMTFTKKIVEENIMKWDILRYQDKLVDKDYLGFLYDQNYDINTMPNNYVLSLLIDYYIEQEPDFFEEKNQINSSLYQKIVSKDTLFKKAKEMFGPDYQLTNVDDISIGCGKRILNNQNNTFTIQSNDPESCGAFDDSKEQYISHIGEYFKIDDNIIINIQVAYMSPGSDERIVLYTNKNKLQVLDYNYPYSCLGSTDENCYNTFSNYQVTLKKASDNKYYFYSISKT